MSSAVPRSTIEPNRLFFALLPDSDAQAALMTAARALTIRMQPGGKPVRQENLHLTLAFLGDAVSAEQEAAAITAAATVQADPFTLNLDQANSFPGKSSTWWIGSWELMPELERLHRALMDRLVQAKVSVDRKRFVPHVTVLRDAQLRLPPTRIPPLSCDVSAFALMRSSMDGGATRYQTVQAWPMRGRAQVAASADRQGSLW